MSCVGVQAVQRMLPRGDRRLPIAPSKGNVLEKSLVTCCKESIRVCVQSDRCGVFFVGVTSGVRELEDYTESDEDRRCSTSEQGELS